MSNAHPAQFTRLLVEAATVRPFFAALLADKRERARNECRVAAIEEPAPSVRQQAA